MGLYFKRNGFLIFNKKIENILFILFECYFNFYFRIIMLNYSFLIYFELKTIFNLTKTVIMGLMNNNNN